MLISHRRSHLQLLLGTAFAVVTAVGASLEIAPGFSSPAAVSAQAAPDIRPVTECITPQADGSYNAVFGWEFRDPGTATASATIPVGPTNQLNGGTIVNGPTTDFDYPVGGAASPAHVVWPVFVWDPPTRMRSGRTQWWPAEPAVVNFASGSTARYRLNGRTSSATNSSNFQRCSQHLFVTKDWNGSATPPAELDKQSYEIVMTHTANALEPTVRNTGVTRCRYLEYAAPSVPFAPYGVGFTTVESERLNCSYENDLPYTSDIGGYWVPRGTTYTVAESGLPAGWTSDAGIGDFTAEHTDPDNFSRCGYYASFGTSSAVLDSDGGTIPEFGRASAKWCRHQVTSPAPSADLAVTKTIDSPLVDGAEASWTVTVTNNGPGVDPGPIVITDTLPSGATFASAAGAGLSCTGPVPVICTSAQPLAVGASITVTIGAQLDGVGGDTLVNSASASGGGSDTVSANDAGAASAPVQATTTTTVAPASTTTTTMSAAPTTTVVATTTPTASATTTPINVDDELPATGSGTGTLQTFAALSVGFGAALIAFTRRRPRAEKLA